MLTNLTFKLNVSRCHFYIFGVAKRLHKEVFLHPHQENDGNLETISAFLKRGPNTPSVKMLFGNVGLSILACVYIAWI